MNKRLISIFEKIIIALVVTIIFLLQITLPDLPVFSGFFNTVDGSLYFSRVFDSIIVVTLILIISNILIPKYLSNNKIVKFIILLILLYSSLSIIEYIFDYLTLLAFNLPTEANEFLDKMLIYRKKVLYNFTVFEGNFYATCFALSYGLIKDWLEKNENYKELQKEKLTADLAYLKSQVNPHFLFNSLNNITALSLKNEDDETYNSILQLSNLLRYNIYESDEEFVSLTKEVKHIENYIEIFILKYSKEDNISILFNKNDNANDVNYDKIRIAPLLLLPFVENALKHGINSDFEGDIRIDLKINNQNNKTQLIFEVDNSDHSIDSNKSNEFRKHSGIGLENVKKRLELIYPSKYNLDINNKDGRFSIYFCLDYDD